MQDVADPDMQHDLAEIYQQHCEGVHAGMPSESPVTLALLQPVAWPLSLSAQAIADDALQVRSSSSIFAWHSHLPAFLALLMLLL